MAEEIEILKSDLNETLSEGELVLREWSLSPDRMRLSGGIEAVKGLVSGPLDGGSKTWLTFVHAEDIGRFSDQIVSSLNQGGSYEIEYRLNGKSKPVWVRERGIVHHNSQREPRLLVSLVRDISEIQDLENRLAQARKMEAFGKLAGGVAHDFNNILAVILGYSQLVLSELSPNDPQLHFVEEIESAARRAASLTNQLLAFTRQEVQGTSVLLMDNVLREMGKMLGRLIGEQITLAIDPQAGESGKVLADRNQIEQLLIHLSICARDLLPNGGFFTLSTRLSDSAAPAGTTKGNQLLIAAECRSIVLEDGKSPVPGAVIPWTNNLPAAISSGTSVATVTGAQVATATINTALASLATMRAQNGSEASKLKFGQEMLVTNRNNLEAANSRIIDVDVAAESTQLARFNILQQAGTAMLAQANQSAQSVLRLLS